jgi:hypothetical protein
MSTPITIQPPANSVTVMVGSEPFMITSELSDKAFMNANRIQREIAVGLLRAAIEVMQREDFLGPIGESIAVTA